MKRLWMASAVVACALVGVAFAGELKSGLQPGDAAPPFNVRDITGPHQGETLCYRCQNGLRPVVCVFAREVNDDVTNLVKQIDEKVAANKDKKMAAFVVVLTEDPDKTEAKLKGVAKDKSIKETPLTLVEGAAGPENYKIAKDADVTVMMWVGLEVKANYAFPKGKLDKDAIKQVVEGTSKILQ